MPVSPAASLQTSPEEAALGAGKCSDVWSSRAPGPASPAAPRHQLAGKACVCYVLTGASRCSEHCFLQGLAVFVESSHFSRGGKSNFRK